MRGGVAAMLRRAGSAMAKQTWASISHNEAGASKVLCKPGDLVLIPGAHVKWEEGTGPTGLSPDLHKCTVT